MARRRRHDEHDELEVVRQIMDGRPPALVAETLRSVGRLALADVCEELGLPATGHDDVDGKAIAAALAQAPRALAVLEELPAACLVVLEGLIEMRGALGREEVEALLEERTGLGAGWVQDVVAELAAHGLVMVNDLIYGSSDYAWVLLGAPAHAHCVALVRGLTLPSSADDELVAEPRLPCPQELLAIAGLLAHQPLWLTKTRWTDKKSLRRLARKLGRDADEIDAWVTEGLTRTILGTDAAGRIRPVVPKMIAGATGEDVGLPATALDWFLTWILPVEGWASVEAVARALARDQLRRPYPDAVVAVRAELEASERFETGSRDGTRFMRRSRAEPRTELVGDGWIDEKLEVHLGACATSACVAWISLSCELERLDPELIYRLSERSVGNARESGVPLERILEALDSVGDEGLADDVRARVREWYERAEGVTVSVENHHLGLDEESAHYARRVFVRAGGAEDDDGEAIASYPLACEAAPSLRKRYVLSVAEGFVSDARALEGRRALMFGEADDDDLLADLEAACESRALVRVHVRSTGERVWVKAIRIHAPDSLYGAMLVAVDVENQVDRVIAVHDIRGLRPELERRD